MGKKSKKKTTKYSSNNNNNNNNRKKITKKKDFRNEYIPDFEIKFGPSFATLHVMLEREQSVFAEAGSYNRMNRTIKMHTGSKGGILKGLRRSFTGTTSMFLNTFTGTSSIGSKLVLASHLPGDILPLMIYPGQKIITSSHAFLGATNNIAPPDTRFRGRNFFLGSNIFLSVLKVDSRYDHPGMIWLKSYGPHKKITLKEDEEHLVDGGLFLCSDGDIQYDIVKPSRESFFRSVALSGEGFSMKFTGPCEFYVSGRNVGGLISFIQKQARKVCSR